MSITPCAHPECAERDVCCFDSGRPTKRKRKYGSHCLNGLQCVIDFGSCVCICDGCRSHRRGQPRPEDT
jgi:hypothetical protein